MASKDLNRGKNGVEQQLRRLTHGGGPDRGNRGARRGPQATIHLLVVLALALLVVSTASAQEALKVDTAGNVGVGTSTPQARLDVEPKAGTNVELYVKNNAINNDVIDVVQSGTSGLLFRVYEAATGEGVFSVFNAAGGENLRFTGQAGGRLGIGCASGIGADLVLNANGGGPCGTGTESKIDAGATQFTVTSSRSIKTNIVPIQVDDILDKVSHVGVYTYDFINGPGGNLGLMAEDFHQVFGRGSDKLLSGQEITMALWLAVQQLTAENKELRAKLNTLDTQVVTELAEIRAKLSSESADGEATAKLAAAGSKLSSK